MQPECVTPTYWICVPVPNEMMKGLNLEVFSARVRAHSDFCYLTIDKEGVILGPPDDEGRQEVLYNAVLMDMTLLKTFWKLDAGKVTPSLERELADYVVDSLQSTW